MDFNSSTTLLVLSTECPIFIGGLKPLEAVVYGMWSYNGVFEVYMSWSAFLGLVIIKILLWVFQMFSMLGNLMRILPKSDYFSYDFPMHLTWSSDDCSVNVWHYHLGWLLFSHLVNFHLIDIHSVREVY